MNIITSVETDNSTHVNVWCKPDEGCNMITSVKIDNNISSHSVLQM